MSGTILERYKDSNGELHRTDGPAIVFADGSMEWYIHGRLHRDDGPAKETSEGAWWYSHGRLHRAGGPAIVWARGGNRKVEWFLHGYQFRPPGYWQEVWSTLCEPNAGTYSYSNRGASVWLGAYSYFMGDCCGV